MTTFIVNQNHNIQFNFALLFFLTMLIFCVSIFFHLFENRASDVQYNTTVSFIVKDTKTSDPRGFQSLNKALDCMSESDQR